MIFNKVHASGNTTSKSSYCCAPGEGLFLFPFFHAVITGIYINKNDEKNKIKI